MKLFRRLSLLVLVVAAGVAAFFYSTARGEPVFLVVVDPTNPLAFYVTNKGEQTIKIGMSTWGANWSWVYTEGKRQGDGDLHDVRGSIKISDNQIIKLAMKARESGRHGITLDYELQADQDIPLTMVAALLGAPDGTETGGVKAVVTAEGKDSPVDLPAQPTGFDKITKIVFTGPKWKGPIEVAVDPPLQAQLDGGFRMRIAAEQVKKGTTKATLTFTFPEDVALMTKPTDVEKFAPLVATDAWFAFRPKYEMGESVIGMENWLEKPAGKRGLVKMVGDHFEFADGTRAKFWGTNLSFRHGTPEKSDADFTVARFAKYGVNAVRLHKFTGPGWEGIGDANDSTKLTPDGLARLDYFSSELAKHGIYYGWSHTFHFKIRPGDKPRLKAYDELMKKEGDTYAVINWAEDVQDLLIEQTVALLNHVNPLTGKKYAEDPALNFVELQNEDDIFFFTSIDAFELYPTYRQELLKRYSEWLKEKYSTREKLAAAWEGFLKDDETFEKNNIAIQPNPWHSSDKHLPFLKGGERTRLLDNDAFLYATQKKFYDRYAKAIRGTGYAGPLIGSCWQAPSMLPHYYNLFADYQVGYIDRHAYYGGLVSDTMMKTPGGGILSAGLQHVIDRPFGVSEWIHVYPSLYSTEGPVIVAAYGMGLQGWDASYEFQSVSNHLGQNDPLGQLPFGVWNADAPTQIGQNPVLSRMVLRGDVKEGPVISVRKVAPDDLAKGEFNFSETVKQEGDIKSFGGTVPPEALAAGRAVVEFVDKPTPSVFPDMTKYTSGKVITSETGQLKWDADGVITIDTPGTQGVCGFAKGKEFKLADATIASDTPYASILLTASGPTETIATAKRLIVSAMARNSNYGFRVLTIDMKTILENGKGPVMLEPVKATIKLPGRKITQVRILDHDGRFTTRNAEVKDGVMMIDGSKDRALYYEVILE